MVSLGYGERDALVAFRCPLRHFDGPLLTGAVDVLWSGENGPHRALTLSRRQVFGYGSDQRPDFGPVAPRPAGGRDGGAVSRQTTATEIRANAALTAGYIAATDFPVSQGTDTVTLWLIYTRNGASTTGFPSIELQWKGAGVTVDGNTLSGGFVQVPETYPIGPTAATIKTAIKIVVPDGAATLSALIKETGDTTNLGSARLLAARGGEPVGALY